MRAVTRGPARIVRDGADVLEDLGLGDHRAVSAMQPQLPLNDDELRVLAALGDEARHIDELAEDAGLAAHQASGLLVTLELRGLVRNHGAQYYVRS